MTIGQMTCVSHIFAAAAVVSAVLAAALFFVFDMRRVWRVLRSGFGTGPVRCFTVPRGTQERTEETGARERTGSPAVCAQPPAGDTEPVASGIMRLLQNITYTEYRGAVHSPISQCVQSTLQIYRRKSYSKAHPDAGEPE